MHLAIQTEKETRAAVKERLEQMAPFGKEFFDYDKASQWLAHGMHLLGIPVTVGLNQMPITLGTQGILTEQYSISSFIVTLGVASWKMAKEFQGPNTMFTCTGISSEKDSMVKSVFFQSSQYDRENRISRSVNINFQDEKVSGLLMVSCNSSDKRHMRLLWHFKPTGGEKEQLTQAELLEILPEGELRKYVESLAYENFTEKSLALISGKNDDR